jgi:hypothetical protein
MDIDLVPVSESAKSEPEEKAPEPLPEEEKAPEVLPEKEKAPDALPQKRGRGRPPGAKNKAKPKAKPQQEIDEPSLVEEALPLATPRGNRSSSSSVTYEQAREQLLPPKPMTPLELSRHLRELTVARQQEKRSYYGKMLAHLM